MTRPRQLLLWAACAPLGALPAAAPEAVPTAEIYQLELALDAAPPAAGETVSLHLRLTPRPGWELKTTTPMNLKLSATPPLRLPRATFTAADWSPGTGAAQSRQVTAQVARDEAGTPSPKTVSAEINFFLCSKTLCRRFVDRATLPVPLRD